MRAKHIRTYDKREIKSTQKWRLINLTHTKNPWSKLGKQFSLKQRLLAKNSVKERV